LAQQLVLNSESNLPIGVHSADLDTVDFLFGRQSQRRRELMASLRRYIHHVHRTTWPVQIILDGSFVMSLVEQPDDVDILLVFPASWDASIPISPAEYNLLWRRLVRRDFDIQVFPFFSASDSYKQWTEFFTRIKPHWRQQFGWSDLTRKGILRIVL
jgi:hypothetical protein